MHPFDLGHPNLTVLVNDRVQAIHHAVEHHRRTEQARPVARFARRRLSRAVGLTLIRLGERLHDEPTSPSPDGAPAA